MLTLTYDCEHNETYSLYSRDAQNFMKRFRKRYSDNKISYFMCGEYGEQFDKPHYHYLIFGISMADIETKKIYNKLRSLEIEKLWNYGYSEITPIEERSIRYVTGYVMKQKHNNEELIRQKEFVLMSKGIGKEYYEKYKQELVHNLYKGKPMPRYYIKLLKEEGYVTANILENKEAAMLVTKGKAENMREAKTAIVRRNRQQEIDGRTLKKMTKGGSL